MTILLLITLLAMVSPPPGSGIPSPAWAQGTAPDSLGWPAGNSFAGFS